MLLLVIPPSGDSVIQMACIRRLHIQKATAEIELPPAKGILAGHQELDIIRRAG
jgi:hypothetical protein